MDFFPSKAWPSWCMDEGLWNPLQQVCCMRLCWQFGRDDERVKWFLREFESVEVWTQGSWGDLTPSWWRFLSRSRWHFGMGSQDLLQKGCPTMHFHLGCSSLRENFTYQSKRSPWAWYERWSEPWWDKRIPKIRQLLQMAISLGRYNIFCATMSMGRFRSAPKVVHLKRLICICSYLKKSPGGAIHFCTEILGYSHLDHTASLQLVIQCLWGFHRRAAFGYAYSKRQASLNIYIQGCQPHAIPHCWPACTIIGILHLVNSTPADWFCKLQGSVETATYSSEFVAAWLATEQIMNMCHTLRSLGAPILDGKAYMFGDNASVITSLTTIPHSSLNKCHNALSNHRVREAIALNVFVVLLHFR